MEGRAVMKAGGRVASLQGSPKTREKSTASKLKGVLWRDGQLHTAQQLLLRFCHLFTTFFLATLIFSQRRAIYFNFLLI